MKLFTNLFSKNIETDVKKVAYIEAMMRAHLKRIQSALRGRPDAEGLIGLCNHLLSPTRISSAASLISREVSNAFSNQNISSTSELTIEWFVVVSVCPWLMPNTVLNHLSDGYLTLLDQLTKPAYFHPEGRHVVHWIYCSDGKEAGIHVTIVPNPKVVHTQAVFAQDFLTATERRKVGL